MSSGSANGGSATSGGWNGHTVNGGNAGIVGGTGGNADNSGSQTGSANGGNGGAGGNANGGEATSSADVTNRASVKQDLDQSVKFRFKFKLAL